MVMVLGDRLGLTGIDPKKLAEDFISVGRYWQRHSQYAKAAARLKRAIELDEKRGVTARVFLARVLLNWVAD